MVSAAEAATSATISGSFSMSWDENLRHHQRFVAIAVGEQRTDRPVDQARDQGFAFGRRALALEIAARNLAGGVITFLVVHGEREEIHAFARDCSCAHHGGQHNGLAIGGQHRAVGLAGDLAGFERQRAAAPFEGFFMRY